MEVATPLVVRSHSTASSHHQQQSHRQFIQQQQRSLTNESTTSSNLHHHHNQSHQRLDHPELLVVEQENIETTPIRVKSASRVKSSSTNTTCGGGLSLSSARRAHLVSRGTEFIAHQTTSNNTTKFGLNNNTTSSSNNSYNSSTNLNNSHTQLTKKFSSGSPNTQKTK